MPRHFCARGLPGEAQWSLLFKIAQNNFLQVKNLRVIFLNVGPPKCMLFMTGVKAYTNVVSTNSSVLGLTKHKC